MGNFRTFLSALLGLGLLVFFAPTAGAQGNQSATTHTVEIRAKGQTADERMQLAIGDQTVDSFDVTTSWAIYTSTFDSPSEPSAVAVKFINDLYQPPYDRNLFVDYIVIDGVRLETEEQTVLSTGSYNPADGCKDGFKRSELLSCQGQFVFDVEVGGAVPGEPTQPPATTPPSGGGHSNLTDGVIEHCGDVSEDETWPATAVHVVTCPVTINGAVLTISPGAIIKFEPEESGATIIVGDGSTLTAIGEAGSPVIFTSIYDDARGGDSNGTRSSSTLRPGRYGTAITVSPGSQTTLDNVLVDYASVGLGDLGSDSEERAELLLSNSTIQRSLYLGINFDEPQTDATVAGTLFAFNQIGGARFADGASVVNFAITGSAGNRFEGTSAAHQLFLGGVEIPEGKTWNFSPANGAVLTLENDYSLEVFGRLNVRAESVIKISTNSSFAGIVAREGGRVNIAGRQDAPVILTSVLDDNYGGDTNLDGQRTTASAGLYGAAITVSAGSTVTVDHAEVRFGENGIRGLRTEGSRDVATLRVTNSAFVDHLYFGIHVNRTAIDAAVSTSTFRDNGIGGARITSGNSPARFVMSGAGANSFEGNAQSRQLWLSGAVLPAEASWTFAPTTGASLSIEHAKSLTIRGTLNIAEGSVIKVSSNSKKAGFHVTNGGELFVTGSSRKPVVITSVIDDNYIGDSNGDADKTSAGPGNYRTAVWVAPGGVFDANNIDIAHARVGVRDTTSSVDQPARIKMKNALIRDVSQVGVHFDEPQTVATFQRTTIRDAGTGIYATKGSVRFRGALLDVNRGVRACDFGAGCNVDAQFVDWGTRRGPINADGSANVCGEVNIGNWKNQRAVDAGIDYLNLNCTGTRPE